MTERIYREINESSNNTRVIVNYIKSKYNCYCNFYENGPTVAKFRIVTQLWFYRNPENATVTLQKFITCSLQICVALIYFTCQKMFVLKSVPCLPCIYSNVSNNKSPGVLTQRGIYTARNTLWRSLYIEGKNKKGCIPRWVERGNNLLSFVASAAAASSSGRWFDTVN